VDGTVGVGIGIVNALAFGEPDGSLGYWENATHIGGVSWHRQKALLQAYPPESLAIGCRRLVLLQAHARRIHHLCSIYNHSLNHG
jgi:hypothetical protein